MDIKELKSLVLKWEGGDGSKGRDSGDKAAAYPCPTKFVDPKDKKIKGGWHTVEGITYGTWVGVFGKNQDIRWWNMSDEDWFKIFNEKFFKAVGGADSYKSFNVLAVVCDIAFMSGAKPAIKNLQRAAIDLGAKIKDDGDFGGKTKAAVNNLDPKKLITAIVERRKVFLIEISENGSNSKFLKGWLNRTNDYLKSYSKGL